MRIKIRGMSLIEVVVAIGVVGLLVVVVSKMLLMSSKGVKHTEMEVNRTAIKSMLMSTVSCPDTLTAGVCASSTIPLIRRHPNGTTSEIASGSGAGTKLSGLTVRANCNATEDGIIIRTAKLKPNGTLASTATSDFVPDPLTGRVETWASDQTLLFGAGVEVCPNAGGLTIESGGTVRNASSLKCYKKTISPLTEYTPGNSGSITYWCDGDTGDAGPNTLESPDTFMLSLNCSSFQGMSENAVALGGGSCLTFNELPLVTHTNTTIAMLCCRFI